MTQNRRLYHLFLSILTAAVVFMIGGALLGSWTQPQAQSQLNLYESDLLLQASNWQPATPENQTDLPNPWGNRQPVETALKNYQRVRTSAAADLDRLQANERTPAAKRVAQAQFLDELDLRLGILYAETGETDRAIATWHTLIHTPHAPHSPADIEDTAQVLTDIWQGAAPERQQQLQTHLSGWFRTQALSHLLSNQQAEQALKDLQTQTQIASQRVVKRLLLIQGLPITGSLIGVVLLITWLVKGILGQRSAPPAQSTDGADSASHDWATLIQWPLTTIWQVMVVWFTAFFGVSLMVPLVLAVLGLQPETFGARAQALVALSNYSALVLVGLAILYFSLKPFVAQPLQVLPLHWQGSWLKWGLSGYLVALPLVIVISLVNQKLLHNQGGGNPLLEIILHSHDLFSMVLLWGMVAILAPLFEEILFRGFFLTSLTRYLPTWGAIGVSALVFAIAHLNISDILPLTVLGCVLGTVYSQSRNLLASMVVHSLWNSGSFIGLLILGSSIS